MTQHLLNMKTAWFRHEAAAGPTWRLRIVQAEDKEQQTPLTAAEPHGKLQAIMQQAANGEIDVDDFS